MNVFRKILCGVISISIMLSCMAVSSFAADLNEHFEVIEIAEDTAAPEIPSEKKTIYNFECKESSMSLKKTETIGEIAVPYYQGYENSASKDFHITKASFPAFNHGTLFKRQKGVAANVTYKQPAYGNNGSPYDGKEGRDYFMTFDITNDATVYVVDREREGWPAQPDDWFVAGHVSGMTVFGKHFEAGQKVEVPSYGWNEKWDKTANRLFLDPGYYVVAWDNDPTLESLTYSADLIENIEVDGFKTNDFDGEYNVNLEYKKSGYDISLSIIPKDNDATVTMINGQESFKLTYENPVTVSWVVTSEAGDETATYTVTYSMKDKKNPGISINPVLSEFGAGNQITNIYESDNCAGDTFNATVPIASYDEKSYFKCAEYKVVYIDDDDEKTAYVDYSELYNYIDKYDIISASVSKWMYTDENMYTINKGDAFFTDEGNFGVTGSAYNNMNHVMTSSQLAPGNVDAEAFENATAAQEFKNWLLNSENYAYKMKPTNNCVVYVAFTQAKAKEHSKFINDGWTFNDYSGVTIPKAAVLSDFKDYSSYKWWMADPAYSYNGYPFLLVKNQYSKNAATVSRNYCYIWSKEVKAGEEIEIPVGGSAFSSVSDKNAPKTLFIWKDNQIRDDVSGKIMVGKRSVLIDNYFESRPLPEIVANIGDKISFVSEMGAKAEFSETVIQTLPCTIDVNLISEAGTSVAYSLNVKSQPKITSLNISPKRDEFVLNTGDNKIELSPYLVGELTYGTANRQVFEQDEEGVLRPVYGSDGKYIFERAELFLGSPFYRDRKQHKFCHVGQGFRNLQYFWIPSNDSVNRRRTVYSNENATYAKNNGGEEKLWSYINEDGVEEKLNCSEISSRYADYILGDNEYFNFTADSSGVVYVALESESANFNVANGWKHMTVAVPLPSGHASWSSVDAEITSQDYPYQLGKIQYDGHATEYHIFDEIYYKSFSADEKVSIPTSGVGSSDVMAVMVGWEDFVTDDAGGTLFYGKNAVKIRDHRETYTINVYSDEDLEIFYKPAYPYSRVALSDTKVKLNELPKTVTAKIVNAFCAEKVFEIEFVKGNLGKEKIYNFDTASDYAVYETENAEAYNADKGFIKFSEGVYMIEENLERGVSAYYSDRLTHKFTKENTSELFEGATYIRRPKKSNDYGNMGLSCTSVFYTEEAYNGKGANGYWVSFGVSSDADVYVGVPGDGIWPNKPDDFIEVADESIKLAGCTKVYMKSYKTGDFVGIPSMGWNYSWEKERTSWDLPVYVVVWK